MNDCCIDQIPAGVIIVDKTFKIVDANAKCEQVIGYTAKELVGMSVHDLVPDDFKLNHMDQARGYMNNPSERCLGIGRDLTGLRKDGSSVPMEISLTPMSDGRVLVMMIDISVRKKVAEIHEKLGELRGVLQSTINSIDNCHQGGKKCCTV